MRRALNAALLPAPLCLSGAAQAFDCSKLGTDTLNFGIGYVAAPTSRRVIAGGFPVPMLPPLASIHNKDYSLMGACAPRLSKKQDNGDVLFLFGHIRF